MRRIALLVRKDGRLLRRSPALVAALIVYPLIVAVLVGLVVRYAGEEPRVALVDLDDIPAVVELGGLSFVVDELLDGSVEDVELVRLDAVEAARALRAGDVLATITIPDGFIRALRGMLVSPELRLEFSNDLLGSRILAKVESLVFSINRTLQDSYINTNLVYVDLLTDGGSGTFAGNPFDIIGLNEAGRRLNALESANPEFAPELAELETFVNEAGLAIAAVEDSLRATAHPIELVATTTAGRDALLSSLAQAFGLALTLAFIAVVLAAGSLAAERDENVLGRLLRGLVRPSELLASKALLVALLSALVALILALAFGVLVETSGAAADHPWERLPLLFGGFLLAGVALGAFGGLVGVLARDARTATLVALLLALPLMLLGLVPAGSVSGVGVISDLFPFSHSVEFSDAVLSEANPTGSVLRASAWLVGLGLAYGAAARLGMRRLLT
ncbi:MAG: ABC transporter permease [Gaiellaceae bacterium]